MEAVFVRADDPVRAFFGGEIGIHSAFEADWAERAAVGTECGKDVFGLRHGQRRFHARQFFGFDVVELMVAAQQQQHQFAFVFAFHHDGFERGFHGNL